MDTTVSPGRNTQFPFSSSYSALSPSLRIFSRSTIEVNIPFPSTQQTPREEVPLSVSVFFTLKPIAQQWSLSLPSSPLSILRRCAASFINVSLP